MIRVKNFSPRMERWKVTYLGKFRFCQKHSLLVLPFPLLSFPTPCRNPFGSVLPPWTIDTDSPRYISRQLICTGHFVPWIQLKWPIYSSPTRSSLVTLTTLLFWPRRPMPSSKVSAVSSRPSELKLMLLQSPRSRLVLFLTRSSSLFQLSSLTSSLRMHSFKRPSNSGSPSLQKSSPKNTNSIYFP